MLLRAQHGAQRAQFGLAEAVVEADLRIPRAQPLQHGHRHDGRAVLGLGQRGEVAGVQLGGVGQGNPHGGGQEQRTDVFFLHQLKDLRDVGPGNHAHGGTQCEVGQQEHVHCGRVVERHGDQRPILGREIQGDDRGNVLGDQRGVRHHGTLGRGCGAGGVQQLQQVTFVHGHGDRLQRRRPVQCGLQQRNTLGPDAGGRPRTREHGPHMLNVRCPSGAADVIDQRQQRVIDHEQARPGILQDVGQLVTFECEVHRYMHQAGLGAGEVQQQVGVRIGTVGGDPGPPRQPGIDQAARDAVDRFAQFGIRPASILEQDRGGRTVAGDRAAQECTQRVGRGRGHRRIGLVLPS